MRGIGFPFGRKVLGLAFYVQMSSLMRTARALSEFRRVSKTAVWRIRVFFNNITVNLRHNGGMRWSRSIECWNLICDSSHTTTTT